LGDRIRQVVQTYTYFFSAKMENTKPKYLYKYEAISKQSLENLKNQVIYFASPSKFNDPFDCAINPQVIEPNDEDIEIVRKIIVDSPNMLPEYQDLITSVKINELLPLLMKLTIDALKTTRENFLITKGISCFSEIPNNLLMWSHYADKQTGFCLEFDTAYQPFTKAYKVEYVTDFPELNISKLFTDSDEMITKLFCTKSKDWSYEKEWRCLHTVVNTPFSYDSSTLTGVYFGPETSFTFIEIIALILRSQNPKVQLWQGKRSASRFSVEFEKFTYTPYLEAKEKGLV